MYAQHFNAIAPSLNQKQEQEHNAQQTILMISNSGSPCSANHLLQKHIALVIKSANAA